MAQSDEFPAVGGRPVLDFVATLGKRGSDHIERLVDPEALARWARHAGIADDMLPADESGVGAARRLREALYELVCSVIDSGAVDPAALAIVNAHAAEAPPAVALRVAGGRLQRLPVAVGARAVLAAVARDGIELLTSADAELVRECEGEACTLLFVDRSRGGRRRWCSMDSCGSRAKMRALRERRHTAQ